MLDDKYLTGRTRAERIHNNWTKAKRKKKISDNYNYFIEGASWYDNLHEYSKGKIHCSCPLCRAKTKNKGKRRKGSYAPSYNPKISEIKLNEKLDYQEDD